MIEGTPPPKREEFCIVGIGAKLCSKSWSPLQRFSAEKNAAAATVVPVRPLEPVGRSVAKIVPFVLKLSLQRITEGSPTIHRAREAKGRWTHLLLLAHLSSDTC